MSKIIGGNVNLPGVPPTQLEQQQQMAKLYEMLKNSTPIKCEQCEGENFIEVVRMRRVSGLVTGIGKEMIVPVPIYACSDCGHVNSFFAKSSGLPEETVDKRNTCEKDLDGDK